MSLHVFALLAAGVLSPSPAPAQPPASEAPSASPAPSAAAAPSATPATICGTAIVSPLEVVNSKTADPGQTFKFSVKSIADPQNLFTKVAPGESGLGLISVVRHARAGGDPGLLVLETRYIVASDGSHVPVALVRTVNGLFMGRTRNSPALLGLIPYVGYVTGTYDALHKGTDVAMGPGDTLLVALGDDAIAGTCSLPASVGPPAPK